MKKHPLSLATIALLIIILFATSCKKSDDTTPDSQYTVDPYSNVNVDGQVKILLNNVSQAPLKSGSEFLVKVHATPEQLNNLSIQSTGGTLYITLSDDIIIADSVIIELNTLDLVEIRLERDQQAIFVGIEQENVSVVTEANSQLSLLESRITNLASVQEGESVLNLTNWSGDLGPNPVFPQEQGVLLNDTTLVVAGEFLVIGDSIVLSPAVPFIWTVYGDHVREYFMTTYCDFKTEGNTTINAGGAPVWEVNINLEGSSQAEVWAIDMITGKGEGSSRLYYRGDPDISGFILEGGAQIIPLN
ncbi:MAG: DUF2807 domain-containing protein [Bacteroidales bacterium]